MSQQAYQRLVAANDLHDLALGGLATAEVVVVDGPVQVLVGAVGPWYCCLLGAGLGHGLRELFEREALHGGLGGLKIAGHGCGSLVWLVGARELIRD